MKSDQWIVSLLLLLSLTIGYIVGCDTEKDVAIVEAPITGGTVVKLPDIELEHIVQGINSLGELKASHRVLFYYANIIRRESNRVGYDWQLVVAMIFEESKFDKLAVSSEGAVGLMQVKPDTAKYIANTIGMSVCREDLFIPETNVKIGVRYLKSMEEQFGSVESALQAYWLGPTAVNNGIVKYGYVRRVMNSYCTLRGRRI